MPNFLKKKIKSMIRRAVPFNAHNIVGSLYLPSRLVEERPGRLVLKTPEQGKMLPGQSFPLPPADLRMGYGDNDADYLATGAQTAGMIRKTLADHGLPLGPGMRLLDWGCASGRVLRCLEAEARQGEFWGIDQASPHLDWDKRYLSPPFKFATCTAYPHLPFEDNSFDVIYAISVFTHLVHLMDAWMLELRRVMAPGGIGIFTIHDEQTLQYFREVRDWRPLWLDERDLSDGMTGDTMTKLLENDWGHTFTFFRTDWAKKEFGTYFELLAMVPRAELYQTAVVVRKASARKRPLQSESDEAIFSLT